MADQILAWARDKQNEFIAFLRELVECESPSDDAAAVGRLVELLQSRLTPLGRPKVFTGKDGYGPHLLCEFDLPGEGKDGQILALGHTDTVYPVGTLASMPFQEKDGRLWGPGIFDMKAGIAMFVFAIQAVREMGLPVRRRVVLQLNSDEEVGSPTSRALTEWEAQKSVAVLVLEPSAGADGKAKTSRKGVGGYTVRVTGRSAHAGLDFASGASAILELARQIERISGFVDLDRGLTVNPGVIGGGTRSNVVAAEAWCEFDFRITRAEDAADIDAKFHALTPVDDRCTIEVTGGLNRPPLERTAGVAALYGKARSLAEELGVPLGETGVGGGSDGNFTAGLGIPTLDGIGAVGDGAHAPHEHILIDRIADRTALLAKLIQAI
jgi:glutamate carboxypeptidase